MVNEEDVDRLKRWQEAILATKEQFERQLDAETARLAPKELQLTAEDKELLAAMKIGI